MSETLTWPRALDHCVLPTVDLDAAAARLGALGFTVAPIGIHPFGTANHCVYFDDGSFLEMLSVANLAMASAAAAAGNVFVAHDRAFRKRIGDEGFSALVLKTTDARRDHGGFGRAGVSAGDILDFSRAFVDAAGNRGEASFRLAFARVDSAPDALVFTCERVGVPKVDRRALQRHGNGVLGVVSVGFAGSSIDVLKAIAGVLATETDAAARPATTMRVEHDTAANAAAGAKTPPRFASVTFGVSDLGRTRSLLDAAGIGYSMVGGRVAVPPAPGQGAMFIFEAM